MTAGLPRPGRVFGQFQYLSPPVETLANTAEREFLALVKIGRDGREIGMDGRDMLDLLLTKGQRLPQPVPGSQASSAAGRTTP